MPLVLVFKCAQTIEAAANLDAKIVGTSAKCVQGIGIFSGVAARKSSQDCRKQLIPPQHTSRTGCLQVWPLNFIDAGIAFAALHAEPDLGTIAW